MRAIANSKSQSQITLPSFHTVDYQISQIYASKQKQCKNGELSRTPNHECVEVQTISIRHFSLSFSFTLHFSLPRLPPPPPRKSPFTLSSSQFSFIFSRETIRFLCICLFSKQIIIFKILI